MKAGIVTIFDPNPNFGNKLQNYAVVQVLDSLRVTSESILTLPLVSFKDLYIKYAVLCMIGKKNTEKSLIKQRLISFREFDKKYLNPTKKLLEKKLDIEKYDYFIIGSDQVWNPNWYRGIKKDAFLLTFAKPEQKICFSPSFGIDKLPTEWEGWFRDNLQTYNKISVREQTGADIVEQLTGKKAEVLLDPSMMLDASQWSKIERTPKHIDCNKPYILTYFLGRCSEKARSDIKKYAAENHCNVYNLLDINEPSLFIAGPREFIYLISHAKLIMTDSFHACVFSFLFQKPFLVYPRDDAQTNMMSRIDNLLDKFELKRKYVESGLTNDILECDYEIGKCILKHEREKVIDFLKDSMKIE